MLGRGAYRPLEERLVVPAETVRDWRLRFCSGAELIAAHFWRWARALDGVLSAAWILARRSWMRLRRSACVCGGRRWRWGAGQRGRGWRR